MRLQQLALPAACAALGLGLGGATVALAAPTAPAPAIAPAPKAATVKVCLTNKNVVVGANAKSKCPKGASLVKINRVGPRGPSGSAGGDIDGGKP